MGEYVCHEHAQRATVFVGKSSIGNSAVPYPLQSQKVFEFILATLRYAEKTLGSKLKLKLKPLSLGQFLFKYVVYEQNLQA